jgi:small multidrug resistance pump
MVYLQLAFSILLEVFATSLMKKTDGFTNLVPTVGVLICYGISFYLISNVVRIIPVGIVYATWSATGIVLVSAAAYFLYKQALDVPAVVGMGLIIMGVIIINLFSKSASH